MSGIKFVDSIPESQSGRPLTVQPLIDQLAANAGTWAEIAKFPKGDHGRAANRGSYMKTKDPRVQTATRTVDGQVILFARVVTQ